jgi:hypothetical protein
MILVSSNFKEQQMISFIFYILLSLLINISLINIPKIKINANTSNLHICLKVFTVILFFDDYTDIKLPRGPP